MRILNNFFNWSINHRYSLKKKISVRDQYRKDCKIEPPPLTLKNGKEVSEFCSLPVFPTLWDVIIQHLLNKTCHVIVQRNHRIVKNNYGVDGDEYYHHT